MTAVEQAATALGRVVEELEDVMAMPAIAELDPLARRLVATALSEAAGARAVVEALAEGHVVPAPDGPRRPSMRSKPCG